MPKILMPYTVHLDNTLRVTPVSTLFYKGDSNAHRFELNVLSKGLQADLSGCTAVYRFYRLQDSTVVSNPASIESGKVVAVLDKACYDYIGRFALTIAIQNGEEETTVFYGDGYMSGNRADTGITGDYVVYDVETLLAKIDEIDTAIANANTAIANANTATENANAAEAARATAESERVAAENYRVGHESTRQMNENNRVSSEKTRNSYEINRRNAETERAAAETARSDAETARVEAEQQRAAAEDARDAAETDRESAEQARAAAEQERADTFAGYEERIVAATPDDEAVNGRAWTSKKTVDSLCMPLKATGNPVQVYPVEGYPLGVKVSWEPTQAGSGDPSPDNIRPITGRDAVSVTRCGKNLSQTNAIGTVTWATSNANVTKLINKLPVGTYRISFTITLNKFSNKFTSETAEAKGLYAIYTVYDGSASYGRQKNLGVAQSIYRTDTLPISHNVIANFTITEEDAGYKKEITFYACGRNTYAEGAPNGALGTAEVSNLQIELGSATTPYEPYTGSTTDIALPETVYGGTLDVETGVVTVDRGITIADGTTNKFYSGETWGLPHRSSPGIVETYWGGDITSSHFKWALFGGNKRYEFIYTSPQKMTGLFATADELNAYLAEQNAAGTPVTFVYKLATPYTIQLTPQQIAALSGVNTLYTDAGTLTVTGREDPRHTIVTLTDRIAALEAAAAGV